MKLNIDELIDAMAEAMAKVEYNDEVSGLLIKEFKPEAKAALVALQDYMPEVIKNSNLPDEIFINEGTEAIITYNALKALGREDG